MLPYVSRLHVPPARMQLDNKASTLVSLRAAVTQAGHEIYASKRQLLLDQAVEQFRLYNAFVAGFRLGWRPVLHALQRACAAVPVYVYMLLISVVLAAVTASRGLIAS